MTEMPEAKPRSILPDAMNEEAFFLIKACSFLRLTYEVRLATFFALENKRKLHIVMTHDYKLSPALEAYAHQYGITIRRHQS